MYQRKMPWSAQPKPMSCKEQEHEKSMDWEENPSWRMEGRNPWMVSHQKPCCGEYQIQLNLSNPELPWTSPPYVFFWRKRYKWKTHIIWYQRHTTHVQQSGLLSKRKLFNKADRMVLKVAEGGMTLPIAGTGSAVIKGKKKLPIRFENALYVLKLSKNLIVGCILLQDQINICTNGPQV